MQKDDGDVSKATETKRWKGILAEERRSAQRAAATILGVSAVAMAAGPLGFFPAADTHVLILVIPVTLAALLLGKWAGCAIGAIAGLAEMLHATYQPYDYYEKYFSTPVNSIALLALFGLLLGALFALACRLPRNRAATEGAPPSRNWARIGALVAASAAGSLFFTTFLQGGIFLANASSALDIPDQLAAQATSAIFSLEQICLDVALIAIPAIATDISMGHLSLAENKLSVSSWFQIWFANLTIVFFLVASGVAYTAVTFMSVGNMNMALSDHLNSLGTELSERDGIVNTLDERGVMQRDELRGFSKQAYRNIDCDLPGWSQDTIILAIDDEILTSSNEDLAGSSLPDLIVAGLGSTSIEEAFKSGDAGKAVEYYQGSGWSISFLLATEVSYDRLGGTGEYQLVAIVPSSETFLNRPLYMYLVGLVFAAMLGAIFLLVMRLLKHVVVQPMDSTNEALRRITAGELDQRVPDSDSIEFSSLSTGINTTVGALEESIAEASARIDRELAAARAIQKNTLPSTFPPFPDIDAFDLYATMDAAREVGGDFYDFFEVGDGRVGFVVADVSGKGIPAALFMMAAKTAIRGAMETEADLAKAISIANRSLCEGNESEMFVTAFASVLDYRTGKLTYVNAGHNKPLVLHEDAWSWLEERSGPFLGSFDWANYKCFETQLAPGDELFAYTDGVNEAFNANDELYGNDRLEEFLSSHTEQHPRQLLRSLRSDLIGWSVDTEQSDDITMLALKFGIPPENGATLVTDANLENFEVVESFVLDQLEKANCPPKTTNHVLIAVEELVVNVCNYAYPDAPADKPGPLRVHFTSRNRPNAAIIEICDDGVPFDPLDRKDPERPKSIEEAKIGGLGLFMTKNLMDRVDYVREGISNVTIITKSWE